MDERLDEIKHNWNETDWGIRKDDIDWLIHQAELRQEQVNKNLQALENIDVIQRSYEELKEENQRYKEILEFYANPQIWKEGKLITDNRYEMPLAYNDNGEKAQQALKGSGEYKN